MLYKDVLTHMDMTHCAVIGLVIFVVVFVFTSLWALTRSKREVVEWAALPLSAGADDDRRIIEHLNNSGGAKGAADHA